MGIDIFLFGDEEKIIYFPRVVNSLVWVVIMNLLFLESPGSQGSWPVCCPPRSGQWLSRWSGNTVNRLRSFSRHYCCLSKLWGHCSRWLGGGHLAVSLLLTAGAAQWRQGKLAEFMDIFIWIYLNILARMQSLPLGPHWGPWSSWGPFLWNGPYLVLIGAPSPHCNLSSWSGMNMKKVCRFL